MSCRPWGESRGQASRKAPRHGVPTTHQLGPLPPPCPMAQLGCKASGPYWVAKRGDIALHAAPITRATLECGKPLGMPCQRWAISLAQNCSPRPQLPTSPRPSHPSSTCRACKGAHQLCSGPSDGTQRDEEIGHQ